MFLKLPVCPHCGTVYQYGEIKKMRDGSRYCYHCKKKFRVRKKLSIMLFMVIVCSLLVCSDLFILYYTFNINLIVMAAANAVILTASILLCPFTVRFVPEKITKSEKRMIKETKDKKHKSSGKR